MKKNVLIIVLALLAPSTFAADLPKWIAGSWKLEAGGTHVEEHWTTADGGLMVGMGKTITSKGRVQFEFIRIMEVDGKVAYVAMPQAKPATIFTLKSTTDQRIVFENPEHDFPQRIIYWLADGKLCARTEGTVNGREEGEEWCFSPMK